MNKILALQKKVFTFKIFYAQDIKYIRTKDYDLFNRILQNMFAKICTNSGAETSAFSLLSSSRIIKWQYPIFHLEAKDEST